MSIRDGRQAALPESFVPTASTTSLSPSPSPSPSPAPQQLATRAMRRFACVGGACEDSCCRDFGIALDRDSMERMRSAVAGHPEQREKLVRLVVLGMPRAGAPTHNTMQLDNQGACPLLTNDGACGLQRDHGESALSTTCAVFPRTSLAVEERVEVTGSLACPELARLTLLADDGLEQDVSPVALVPRAFVGKTLDSSPTDVYSDAFSMVRSTILRLFACDQYPVASRLVFAASLADQVDEFFGRAGGHGSGHAGSARSHAHSQMIRRRLDLELKMAEDADRLRTLHRDLQGFQGGGEVVIAAAASMWLNRRRLTHSQRFGQILDGAMSSLSAECASADEEQSTVTPAQLWRADRGRRAALESRAPGLLDKVLGRYCRHYLLRNPYPDAPSLLSYLGRMALSLASIRLLWTASPQLEARWQGQPDPVLDEQVASRAALTVIQVFTKAISHHVDYMAAIHDGNDQPGVATFGRLVLFAAFV